MRTVAHVLVGVLGMSMLLAQEVATKLAAAQQRIAAKEWDGALELLLPLGESAASDEEMDQVATSLVEVGAALAAETKFAAALRANQSALALRKRLHGDTDHASVASSLHRLGGCLASMGRAGEALSHYEAALAMRKRLYGEGDHPDVANSMSSVAFCLDVLGRDDEALPEFEAALAMLQRLYGEADHPHVATGLNNVAHCLSELGRREEALPKYETALAMQERLFGGADDNAIAVSLNNIASCLQALGRPAEALPQFEAALAMWKRLNGDGDHPNVATGINNLAGCLRTLGRAGEALRQFEAALAMRERLYGSLDHPDVVASLDNVASCLLALGRGAEALPQFEAAKAILSRAYGEADHPLLAGTLDSIAQCLLALGRPGEALSRFEAALAMRTRIFGAADHPGVAASLNNVACCLERLGREPEALRQYEAALAMRQRLVSGADDPGVADSLNNLAFCLQAQGRPAEALPHFQAAMAMRQRLYGEADNPAIADSLNNVAFCLTSMGRAAVALPRFEAASAMYGRLYGDADHPDIVMVLNNIAHCLQAMGRKQEALPSYERAVAMIERLRDSARTSTSLRQSFFDRLKEGGAFEQMQALAAQLGKPADALTAVERSRSRELLDLLEEQRLDAFGQALLRARQRGDEATATRIVEVRQTLETTELESDRLLHQLARLGDATTGGDGPTTERKDLLAQSDAKNMRRRQLLDERARLLGDELPVGKVRTATEIQSALRDGELLLEFTVTDDVNLLYVVARDGDVVVAPIPQACAALDRLLPALLQRHSRGQLDNRGRDPDDPTDGADEGSAAHELFTSLIPADVWKRVQAAGRVFVAAHRRLHRMPLELLVTDSKDGRPVYWLDNGPPISYVPSGSILHWLRRRAEDVADDTTSLDLLAVGDPSILAVEPALPEQGVFVLAVGDGGEGARVGLQPRDVLLSYDGRTLVDDRSLRDARTATEAAIEDGERADAPIPIKVWRRAETLDFEVRSGLLGIQVGRGRAQEAYEASLSGDAQLERLTRSGDLERLRRLPPLRGARLETQAIEAVFVAKPRRTQHLLGDEATEPAVFGLAPRAKYLHFACHGIAEEYAGQSLSMLVLAQPQQVLPGDDGLLKLSDLLQSWPGRLSSCQLVVLSACRTNVGPTRRDEAPYALPIGFLFAGVPAVIASLWAVDDTSTRELMTDFYGRLLAGETDKLAAFTAAKKALRQKFPDPFHWAPFLYIGAPE